MNTHKFVKNIIFRCPTRIMPIIIFSNPWIFEKLPGRKGKHLIKYVRKVKVILCGSVVRVE